MGEPSQIGRDQPEAEEAARTRRDRAIDGRGTRKDTTQPPTDTRHTSASDAVERQRSVTGRLGPSEARDRVTQAIEPVGGVTWVQPPSTGAQSPHRTPLGPEQDPPAPPPGERPSRGREEWVPRILRSSAGNWRADRRLLDPRTHPEELERQRRFGQTLQLAHELGTLHGHLLHLAETGELGYTDPLYPAGEKYSAYHGRERLPTDLQHAINAGLITGDRRVVGLLEPKKDDILDLPGFGIQYFNTRDSALRTLRLADEADRVLRIIDLITIVVSHGRSLLASRALRVALRTSVEAIVVRYSRAHLRLNVEIARFQAGRQAERRALGSVGQVMMHGAPILPRHASLTAAQRRIVANVMRRLRRTHPRLHDAGGKVLQLVRDLVTATGTRRQEVLAELLAQLRRARAVGTRRVRPLPDPAGHRGPDSVVSSRARPHRRLEVTSINRIGPNPVRDASGRFVRQPTAVERLANRIVETVQQKIERGQLDSDMPGGLNPFGELEVVISGSIGATPRQLNQAAQLARHMLGRRPTHVRRITISTTENATDAHIDAFLAGGRIPGLREVASW